LSEKPNPPLKHHYIPSFYLNRWSGTDGKICQFSKPYQDKLVARRCHPEATGYTLRGYELKGFAPSLAQQVETEFFKVIDNLACDALTKMELHRSQLVWSVELRSAWARFLVSLLLRCPEDISALRALWTADFLRADPDQEVEYIRKKGVGDPDTFIEYLASRPLTEIEKSLFETFVSLVDNQKICGSINELSWHAIEFPDSSPSLLTSDRPVIRKYGMSQPGGHIAIPIGPRRLFIATHPSETVASLTTRQRVELAKDCNRLIVGAASKFVYGVDDTQHRFIAKWFGKAPQPRIIDDIVAMRRMRRASSSA
jgi:hypothetical protein